MARRTREPSGTQRTRPAHWQLFFDQKGIASNSHLAEIVGLPAMTVNRMVYGDSRTSPQILRKVAEALKVEPAVIYGLAGWPKETRPWEPPVEAEALTTRQRKAINETIRAFVQPELEKAKDAAHHGEGPAVLPDNVFDLAAHAGPPTPGQAHRDALDEAGEEPQDPGDQE